METALYVSTARNSGTPRIGVGNSMVVPQESYCKQNNPLTLGAIAQSSMPQSLDLISVDEKNLWILNSGATDYLIGSSEHFVSYTPYVGNEKIRIVDSFLVPIFGKGQIVPFEGLSLYNVSHASKLSYNLFSISKVTRELHSKGTFLPESVCLQDLSSGRTIDTTQHSKGILHP
ncbi:reverse transcriptase [Cucumis melo var. makuwa]|uniref:Reverse transcriptase n=1 Tax=Cucumis melo var. makuwa TaxID=1194695 RepID=A0A5D3DYR3_CUCMM|nr:reverse transcriptase [Cucumis melo var. makuwa]